MGLGCITLLMGTVHPVSNKAGITEATSLDQDNLLISKDDESIKEVEENVSADNNIAMAANRGVTTETPTPSPSPTSGPSPTPTPPPVFELTRGEHPDIDKFFNDYYVTKNSCDYSLIKTLLTDSDNAQPLSELQNETRFLDDIRDINCYIMRSYEEGTYIVYVYSELKYVNIKTSYPNLDKFYLITDEDGNLKIFTSEMDEMLETYFKERDQDEKVQELIQMTNDKAKEALEKDVDLRVYLEALFN